MKGCCQFLNVNLEGYFHMLLHVVWYVAHMWWVLYWWVEHVCEGWEYSRPFLVTRHI